MENNNEIWSVYNEDGFSFKDGRLFDKKLRVSPVSPPAGSGSREFTMYDGTQVSL